jgi:hypothetical protein
MYFLVYLSSASTLYAEADLLQILQTSRKNNAALDITGMLLYYGGNIIQVLEGEEHKVKHLYDIIKRDIRHKDVNEISKGALQDRNFPDWSMGFKRLLKEEYAQLEEINQPADTTTLTHGIASQEHRALKLIKVFYIHNQHN